MWTDGAVMCVYVGGVCVRVDGSDDGNRSNNRESRVGY